MVSTALHKKSFRQTNKKVWQLCTIKLAFNHLPIVSTKHTQGYGRGLAGKPYFVCILNGHTSIWAMGPYYNTRLKSGCELSPQSHR